MRYVGIDLYKQSIMVCVADQDRNVLQSRRFACGELTLIDAFFATLGPFEAVVEATASYEWLLARIEPMAQRVRLAHPGKLRVIAESTKKSDKLDDRTLAEFLALDMIPQAYRPPPGNGSTGRWSGTGSSCRSNGLNSALRSAGSSAITTPIAAICLASGPCNTWRACT